MIEITRLSKSYGTNKVLTDIDISFRKGQVYGIVGANGAGKTTLFQCIAGMESYSGSITCKQGNLKNYLGYLTTEPFMLSRITGREYLQLQCHAREIRVKDFDKHNLFDLPLDKYAENYSSGMKKKLAITAILLRKNQIFILDEPFNGVDIHSNMVITDVIHKLKELHKLVIISSHIFATLTDTCDQLLLLKEGKITVCTDKQEFWEIENEMRGKGIGDKIEKMQLA